MLWSRGRRTATAKGGQSSSCVCLQLVLYAIFMCGSGVFAVGEPLAMTIGMVADNATRSVTIFNADTDTILGTVSSIPGSSIGDCSVVADQGLGFVTNFKNEVWVIDLTRSPPRLAPGTNPIRIANAGEDTSFSPDQKFLLVCDGSRPDPVSVIDIATRTQISTFNLGTDTDCNSVEVCRDGSVLVTSNTTGDVRRLTLDSAGHLTDTGEVLFSGGSDLDGPNNVFCAPDGTSGIVITRGLSEIQSFTIPGLDPVTIRSLSGSFGLAGQINPAGDRAFARSTGGTVDVFAYNSSTGALGASPLFTISVSDNDTPIFFGMDQMALHPDGMKLYVPQPKALKVYNARTGDFLSSITDQNIVEPTGVCIGEGRVPEIVNSFVTFDPDRATFHTTSDTTGCPAGFVGTFRFAAQLTNTGTDSLADLVVEVETLTNGNVLQNADEDPGGVGARLTVPEAGDFADGVLSPGESVDVPFVVCLKQKTPFRFTVDVLGVTQ